MSGEGDPTFEPLRALVPDALVARFAHVGAVRDIQIYRSLDTGRDLAVDDRGVTHDLLAGGYWPVPREAAVRYALGEIDERPLPGRR